MNARFALRLAALAAGGTTLALGAASGDWAAAALGLAAVVAFS